MEDGVETKSGLGRSFVVTKDATVAEKELVRYMSVFVSLPTLERGKDGKG